jgi:hypothetical protein
MGKGALVKTGNFWYPARLLKCQESLGSGGTLWHVAWWRGNQFDVSEEVATLVSVHDITDELWHDKEARRGIRVGLLPDSWYQLTNLT